MASSPGPVPSRNALRALRNLAFSTPTIFAGAVGSACCIAALGCETRSRVRLAEKIVATKRTLRSVSNGQGNARVARMFEAAERGEDFLLDSRTPAKRRRRVRHFSAKAVEVEEDEYSIRELESSLAAIQARVHHARNNSERPDQGAISPDTIAPKVPSRSETTGKNGTDAANHSSALQRKGNPSLNKVNDWVGRRTLDAGRVGIDSMHQTTDITRASPVQTFNRILEGGPPSTNTEAAERIRKASLAPHKPASHRVYRSRQETSAETPSTQQPHVTNLDLEARDLEIANPQATELSSTKPLLPENLDTGLNEHLFTETDSNEHLFNETGSNEHLFSEADFVSLDLAVEELQSFEPEGDDLDAEEDDVPPDWSDAANVFQDGYRRAFANQLADEDSEFRKDWHGRRNKYLSFEDPYDITHEGLPTTDLEDINKLSETEELVMATETTPQTPAIAPDLSYLSLRDTIAALLASDRESSLTEAEEAFHRLYDINEHGLLPVAATMLLHRLLANEATRDRAVHILAHDSDQYSIASRARMCELRIIHYMQRFCTSGTLPGAWETEYSRIANAVDGSDISITAGSAETFLRNLAQTKGPSTAEQVYTRIQKKHGLEPAINIDRTLALNYALVRDWTAVNRIMLALQDLQIPRTRPMWYSLTFHALFRVHLRDHSFDASYEYLINAMGYWKLTPVVHITRIFAAACVRARKFNHLREWRETTRQMWPRLEPGAMSRRYGYDVGQAFLAIQATCKDIELTCRALSHGSLGDPFGDHFRSILRDSLSTALQRQYLSTLRVLGEDIKVPKYLPGNLRADLQRAQDLIRRHSSGSDIVMSPEKAMALDALRQEVDAVWQVEKVTSGTTDNWTPRDLTPPNTAESASMAYGQPGSILLPFSSESSELPPLRQLYTIMADTYTRYREAGQAPPHEILHDLVQQLRAQERPKEAVKLLRTVHLSPFVQGKDGSYYDGRLYSLWLEVCEQNHSPLECRLAMWGLLDASREVTLTAEHMVLAGLCLAQHDRHDAMYSETESALEEARYIWMRLRKQRWVQLGAQEEDRNISPWQTWQEQLRSG